MSKPSIDYRDADGYECAYRDAVFVSREKYDALTARLAEAEALLRRVVGAMPDRCADLLMCEVDDFLRADSATHRENERG